MSKPKKSQLNQITFVMVDKTDFASIESGITQSNMSTAGGVSRKAWGTNHGTSTAGTSLAISKTLKLLRSGLWTATLKSTECIYDRMLLSFEHPSCAVQLIPVDFVDNDDSDIMSALTIAQSMASDAASAAQQANSRVLLVQSRVSDLDSRLVSDLSDVLSQLTVVQSMASDAASAAQQGNSRMLVVQSRLSDFDSRVVSDFSDIMSRLSDFQSDFQSRVPKLVATNSQLSDLISAVQVNAAAAASRALINQSRISDVQSFLSDFNSDLLSHLDTTGVQLNASVMSDLRSAIAGVTATLSASDISDIASAVQIILSDTLSNIYSAAQQGSSRALVIQSFASDIRSHVSDLQSDFQSRVPKLVATNSQLSDLHSDLLSFMAGLSGALSDVDSAVSSQFASISNAISDLHSVAITTGVQLNASSLSDLRSAIAGVTATVTASDMSDIASRVDVLLSSRLSDIYSLLSDFQSDFQSRVPSVTVTASDIVSQIDGALSSRLSDILSAAQQANSRVLLNQSRISDVQSLLAAGVPLDASTMSDIRSAITGITASISASDMSDIASRVGVELGSRLSDILSAAVQINSRVLLTQSQASDIYSLLSDLTSDFQSRVPKRVATDSQLSNVHSDILSALGNISVALTASDVSDIASAVIGAINVAGVALNTATLSDIRSIVSEGPSGALTVSNISDIASRVQQVLASDLSDILSAAQQTNSRVLLNQSRISDIYSLLSDVQSDFQSRVPKRVATDSQLSALSSDILSAVAVGGLTASAISDIASAVQGLLASVLSDTLSAAQQTNSRVLLNQSRISDVYSLLGNVPTASDIASKVHAHQMTSLTGVPGVAPTFEQEQQWLYTMHRNKRTQDADEEILFRDDGTTSVAKAPKSDDGTTFTRGEFA